MKKLLEVTAHDGGKVLVDISDEACLKFGFRHKDVVIDPDGDECIIMGVAPVSRGVHANQEVLWFLFGGEAYYWSALPKEADLKQEGFKLVRRANPKEITGDREIKLCFKVVGHVGDKVDEVIVHDMSAMADQQRIFERAGYVDIVIYPIRAVLDKETGDWYLAKFEGPVTINQNAIPAKYKQADINPGISVYDYDRDVLKRRVTAKEALSVMLVMILLVVGIATLGAKAFSDFGIIYQIMWVGAILVTLMVADKLLDKLISISCYLVGVSLRKK